MLRAGFLRNFIIFCAALFRFSCGDLQTVKYAPYDLGKSTGNDQGNSAGNLLSYLQNRNTYLRPDLFDNRGLYDYSYEYDSFLNRIKNFPQTVVSYYPFSLQNIEYSYPRIYNRPYPYAPNMISRNYPPQSNIQTFQDQSPSFRDAEKVEPSEVQIIKHLVPLGYTTELVSPRENIASEPSIDLRPLMLHQSMNFIPWQSNIVTNPFSGYDTDTLLNALSSIEKSNSTTFNHKNIETYRQKVEILISLLNAAPKFANEFFQCIEESKALKDTIQASPPKTPKVLHESSTAKKN